MAEFLLELSKVFSELPKELFEANLVPAASKRRKSGAPPPSQA